MEFGKFKPQLLSNEPYELEYLDYSNMTISTKHDGVRIEVTNKGLYNRSLKRLPNVNIQDKFADVCAKLNDGEVLECEIWSQHLPCREIAGICNSKSKAVPSHMILYAFDLVGTDGVKQTGIDRTVMLYDLIKLNFFESPLIRFVEQIDVHSAGEAQAFYDQAIADGHEGAVLRDNSKEYKKGRVTIKQHIGYKMKPHKEEDLEILEITERMLNLNESRKNELGQSFKRNTVDAKEATGIAAAFICSLPNGETSKVTITGTEDERREIWKNKELYIGRIAVVKSMDFGVKTKLRHPRLLRVKEDVEW